MLNKYRQAFAGNTAWRFSTAGFIARLPVSMVGIGILMYVEAERGSYTIAGAVSGSISIAAASIIAKVTRDRIMRDLDEIYPEYFQHVL